MISTRKNVIQVVLSLLLLVSLGGIGLSQSARPQPVINARGVKLLQIDGLLFKDLNKNNKLDVYEDWRRPIDERVNDLLAQMTVEEKAGLMVGPTLPIGPGGGVSEQAGYGANPFNLGGPITLNTPATSAALLRQQRTGSRLGEILGAGDDRPAVAEHGDLALRIIDLQPQQEGVLSHLAALA